MTRRPPLRGLLLDWAGTTVDHGSRAPVEAFLAVFAAAGLTLTPEEVRGPMGMAKRAHLAALLDLPRVAAAWQATHGHAPGAADVDRLYAQFMPLQIEVVAAHSTVIDGVAAAIDRCRALGLAIGSTTGYTRAMMDAVEPVAAAGGYTADVVVTSDEVAAGRPAPWQNFRAAERLGIYPLDRFLIVDDTVAGIQAARAAGAAAVGITRTGNGLGLSAAAIARLPAAELQRRLEAVAAELRAAGADHVLETVADLPGLIERERLL
jgi:phosphonoacetaldehyde hydrolase